MLESELCNVLLWATNIFEEYKSNDKLKSNQLRERLVLGDMRLQRSVEREDRECSNRHRDNTNHVKLSMTVRNFTKYQTCVTHPDVSKIGLATFEAVYIRGFGNASSHCIDESHNRVLQDTNPLFL